MPPVREATLAGKFFGARHAEGAENLAAFLVASPGRALIAWFDPREAARLLADADDMRGALDRDIAAIDALIGEQLDRILHAPRLQRLEGSWRGLAWLAEGLDPAEPVKLRLLNVTWAEISRDLQRALEFDQSILFRRIYEDEFGMPGGQPYGLLVIDHEVRHQPSAAAPTDDVATIGALAAVAATAFAVVVLPAAPALLGVDEFADLARTEDPAAPLRGPAHARWRKLAQDDNTRFVCVTLPRALARPPWGDDPGRVDGFRYVEYAPAARDRVWMAASYLFAATVGRAFVDHGWPADVRGVDVDRDGGGVVTQLPQEPFRTDPPMVWPRPPLDLVLHDGQERRLVEARLITLVALPYSPDAAFVSVASLQEPRRPAEGKATARDASARLSSQINSILCASRFAHYVKVMGRGMVGSNQTSDRIERRLQDWLDGYVSANVNLGPELRAQKPLRAGRVQVREQPGRPGVFGCVIQLQPHFQLDELAATFRLETEVASVGRAA